MHTAQYSELSCLLLDGQGYVIMTKSKTIPTTWTKYQLWEQSLSEYFVKKLFVFSQSTLKVIKIKKVNSTYNLYFVKCKIKFIRTVNLKIKQDSLTLLM